MQKLGAVEQIYHPSSEVGGGTDRLLEIVGPPV